METFLAQYRKKTNICLKIFSTNFLEQMILARVQFKKKLPESSNIIFFKKEQN